MSRLARICPLGIAQHVIQRGNDRQICFGKGKWVVRERNCYRQCQLKFWLASLFI